jgi:S-adenosylmethionine-dependent methyltransferase
LTTADTFNTSIARWRQSLNEPWNRLRYTLYQANLKRHLPAPPLQILDVGGGSGSDAIPLALQGHTVTLVDYSEKMLAEAHHQAIAQNVADRLTFYQADLASLPTLFPQPTFDLVLCHNVIQYVPDLPAAIQAICAPLLPGGLLSLISINPYSDTFQAALLRLDLDEAHQNLDAREIYTPVFDTTLRRYTAEELIPALEAARCPLLGHYGIRCVTDYIYDNERKYDPEFYDKLQRLELALTDRYPYYLLARLFQLIARKVQSP